MRTGFSVVRLIVKRTEKKKKKKKKEKTRFPGKKNINSTFFSSSPIANSEVSISISNLYQVKHHTKSWFIWWYFLSVSAIIRDDFAPFEFQMIPIHGWVQFSGKLYVCVWKYLWTSNWCRHTFYSIHTVFGGGGGGGGSDSGSAVSQFMHTLPKDCFPLFNCNCELHWWQFWEF